MTARECPWRPEARGFCCTHAHWRRRQSSQRQPSQQQGHTGRGHTSHHRLGAMDYAGEQEMEVEALEAILMDDLQGEGGWRGR